MRASPFAPPRRPEADARWAPAPGGEAEDAGRVVPSAEGAAIPDSGKGVWCRLVTGRVRVRWGGACGRDGTMMVGFETRLRELAPEVLGE